MIASAALDSPSSSSIVQAVLWLEGTLLGTIATAVAVICVAGIGYQALMGRLPARRALTTILGCFILFGAPRIAVALRELTAAEQPSERAERALATPPLVAPVQEPPRPLSDPFDPYAGASGPQR